MIEAIRETGFSLDVQLEIVADAGTVHGSAYLSGVPVAARHGCNCWRRLNISEQ